MVINSVASGKYSTTGKPDKSVAKNGIRVSIRIDILYGALLY